MRRKLIAGNWKMNLDIERSKALLEKILSRPLSTGVDILICPSFMSIPLASKMLEGSKIHLGAQNMSSHEEGAYTGEVSGAFLKPFGVSHVILGHSERRKYFSESDDFINQKVKKALEFGLNPILCLGESLDEREAGLHKKKIKKQIEDGLKDIDKTWAEDIIIAYEPIWAIGSGKTASAEQAQEMCKYIREVLEGLYSETAQEMRILYGGSVNPSNIKDLMSEEDIDGALIGGASLKAEDFVNLVNFGEEK